MTASTTSPKANAPASSRHARVIDDLQQEIAELVLEVGEIAALDGVGDLVGFLDRVGRDGLETSARDPTGSPVTGVRSAAMISIRREMSFEGVMRRTLMEVAGAGEGKGG